MIIPVYVFARLFQLKALAAIKNRRPERYPDDGFERLRCCI